MIFPNHITEIHSNIQVIKTHNLIGLFEKGIYTSSLIFTMILQLKVGTVVLNISFFLG